MDFVPWIELAPPAWQVVFAKLSVKDLVAVMKTCRHLHHLADTLLVWEAQARKWGNFGHPQLGGYNTHKVMVHTCAGSSSGNRHFHLYKALVLDDNRRAAVLSLPCYGAVCNYRYQRPSYFFQCRVLQLEWCRSNNSLSLYFDVRGEFDLRHPATSSLAVVQLKPEVAPHTAGASSASTNCGSSSGSTAAAEAAAAAGVAGTAGCGWRNLRAFVPDGCHLITDKPGHYKGCLTWEARKCCDLLDLLLPAPVQQQQHGQAQGRQQHHSSAPPEQHVHQQRGRRSQAWEEWAEHQLHEEADGVYDWAAGEAVQPAAAAATTEQEAAVGAGHAGGWLWHVFHPHLPGHGHHGHGHAGSSWAEPELGAAATVASLSRDDFTSDAGSCAAAGPRGLVFCYANDLSYFTNWSHHGYGPDYTTALLVRGPDPTAQSQLPAGVAAAGDGSAVAPGGGTNNASGSGLGGSSMASHAASHAAAATADSTADSSLHLPVEPLQLPVALQSAQEPHWVAAWLRLPGAAVQQRGLLDKQVQEESEENEKARWGDLPAEVKRREREWWK